MRRRQQGQEKKAAKGGGGGLFDDEDDDGLFAAASAPKPLKKGSKNLHYPIFQCVASSRLLWYQQLKVTDTIGNYSK